MAVIVTGCTAVALACLWLFGGRWAALAVDSAYTARLAALPASPIGWDGSSLQFGMGRVGVLGPEGWDGPELLIGAHVLGLTGPDDRPVVVIESREDQHLVVMNGAQNFILAERDGVVSSADGDIPAFVAEPGDQMSVTIERSLLNWPTPFELNFMTGNSPSWRRWLYYRLRWRKASGAELSMVWRFYQGYDSQNGWRSPETLPGLTGLVEVQIMRPR